MATATQNTTEEHTLTLTKLSLRQLQEKAMRGQLSTMVAAANNKSLAIQGWQIEAKLTDDGSFYTQAKAPEDSDADYLYSMSLTVTYGKTNKKPDKNMLAGICRSLYVKASTPAMGNWILATVDSKPYTFTQAYEGTEAASQVGYAEVEIPPNWQDNFTHLYGLDFQVRRVMAAIQAGVASEWVNRFGCVLVGEPGCGKTDVLQSWKRTLGDDAVYEFDATAMTAAGAIKHLSEAEILPRILLVEEIEKAPENALVFLLGVLDLRGEIRKTTARGDIQRDTKLLALATVNDYELFKKLNAGALSSRFSNEIFFERPNRDLLAMILTREVQKIDGDERWITPALDYAEEIGETDPRKVIAICLCGGDMLLPTKEYPEGEYQAMLRATSRKGIAAKENGK